MTEQNLSLDCEETRDLLYLFVTGDLDPDEMESVIRHLATCSECRDALAQHTRLNQKLTRNMPKQAFFFTPHRA